MYGAAGDLNPAVDLDAGRNLAFGHLPCLHGEDLGETGELVERLFGNHHGGGVAGQGELHLDEHAGAELGIAVRQAGLDRERARVSVERWIQLRDVGAELCAGSGIGSKDQRASGAHRGGREFRNVGAQAQGPGLDQRDDGRVLPHVLAGRNQARGDLAVKRRAHRGVTQALLAKTHVGAQSLHGGKLRAQHVAGSLVAGLARMQAFLDLGVALLGNVAALIELGRHVELEAGIFHLRLGLADGGRRFGRDVLLVGVEADGGQRLGEGGAGAVALYGQLALVELGDDVALVHGLAEIGANLSQTAGNLGADRHAFIGLERAGDGDIRAEMARFGRGHADHDGIGGLGLRGSLRVGLAALGAAGHKKRQSEYDECSESHLEIPFMNTSTICSTTSRTPPNSDAPR